MTSIRYNPHEEPDEDEEKTLDQYVHEHGAECVADVADIAIGTNEKRVTNTENFLVDRYVEYEVETTIRIGSSIDAKLPPTFTVFRRYSDFEALRTCLVVSHPSVIVPPLPEKVVNVVWKNGTPELDKFNDDLIGHRRCAFQTFLVRVSKHSVLSAHPKYHDFLTRDYDFKVLMSGVEMKSDSFFKQLSATIGLKKPDKRFLELKTYADALEESTKEVIDVRRKVGFKRLQIYKLFADLAKQFNDWSGIEPEMGDCLQSASHRLDGLAGLVQGFSEQDETQFGEPMKEYQLYADAMRSVAKKGEIVQYECEQTEQVLHSKVKAKADFEKDPNALSFSSLKAKLFGGGPSIEERRKEHEQIVKKAEESVERAQEELSSFVSQSERDMETFHRQKREDIKRVLIADAKLQLELNRKSLSAWRNLKETFHSC
ncbi:sorting nexin-4-like [Oscarella lobularis]|uniref:sorting nexin-4-like n=1 Tax=Oscarella lobularis TaxID=121494 RepID=UPI0033135DCE